MFEDFMSLVKSSRSVRRFAEGDRIEHAFLRRLADAARQTASAGNLQPLRFVLVSSAKRCEQVFPALGWAAYLKDWKGPEEGERPSAYFVICADKDAKGLPEVDAGIVSQTVMLGAVAAGFGACILGSVDRKSLHETLELAADKNVLYVIALGRPAERIELQTLPNDGDVRYWRDAQGVHHVPKRALDDVIIGEFLDD